MEDATPDTFCLFAETVSWTRVFHSPQLGHLPNQPNVS
ncbi:hypothetical protein KKC1_03050 [Calderihabitans maritimus]|uniref:Uncharacterized protein n=1 Tax=Calderihabitans maritimus TaxID=1246530 RepID=A0A1Z5HNP6_9FIRM|nr:hypothetical protein KKC1_03050 [Calderihabitans maritimus]